jgi:multidrug efflux pump subunit AcrA (membrane-fusion protein)
MEITMPSRFKTILYISLFLSMACFNMPATAHGDEIEVTEGTKGPVQLSQEQVKMLELQVAKASPRPLAQLLALNGQIELLPDAQADVGVRISGSVTALNANLGDTVKEGQRLATVQSRLIGDPPPSVAVNAPISGIIDARNVTLGQAVEPNTVLFHISNRDMLLVIAKVYEEDLEKVVLGQDVNIHVLSYPSQIFYGKVVLIEPNLDVLTRTVNVRISVNNKENRLKPGMFVRANLVLSKNDEALAIPNAALLEANGEQFVFVRTGTTYDRVEVSVGVSDDDYTEITKGLVPGDEVVTQGNRQLYTLWLSGSQSQTTKEGHH